MQLATQLGLWLRTTGPLQVVTPAAAAGRPAIVVGAAAATAAGAATPEVLHALGPEAFWCSISSSSSLHSHLFLAGGLDASGQPEPRGTINGVFEYLRECGTDLPYALRACGPNAALI